MTTTAPAHAAVRVGDLLPEHVKGPISRTTLALFAGASHDHNPIHIDIDVAKSAGLADVFAHGMLSMAYLAQMLTRWRPQSQLREFGVRFVSITPVLATVCCGGEVTELFEREGEPVARVRIWARTAEGVATLDGEAIVAVGKD